MCAAWALIEKCQGGEVMSRTAAIYNLSAPELNEAKMPLQQFVSSKSEAA